MPAAQSGHEVAPSSSAYVPDAHSLHVAEPVVLVKVPISQRVHAVDPADAYSPGWHETQLVALSPAVNLPAGHVTQLVAPVVTPTPSASEGSSVA